VHEQDRQDRVIHHLELAWYAEFLVEIDLKNLLRKTVTRFNLKIILISLHIDPGLVFDRG
jgi:hypothetical protein